MEIRNILSKKRFFILIIFIIAFFLRLLYPFFEKIVPYSDAKHYNTIAINISTGKGYTEGNNPEDDERALLWPPFYPFLLAILYKIFGHHYSLVWIFQAIISTISCILIYLIAKKAFSQKVAIFSLVISAIFFHFILYTAMLLTETIFIFFVLLFFILLFDIVKSRPLLKYALLGILVGVAILTRPILVVFALFFFLWELKNRSLKKALIFIICIGLIILPWIIRNYIIYQYFIFISVGGTENFWRGNHPKATGEEHAYPEEMRTNPDNLSWLKLMSQGYSKGMKFIVQNPMQAFILIPKKASLFFSLLRNDGWWPHMQGWQKIFASILSFILSLLLFSLGIIGFVFSYRNDNSYKFWMRSFIIVSFLSFLPFIVEARFRFPIYPFMIIFTGYGLILLPELKSAIKFKEKMTLRYLRTSMILIAILLLNTIYDFIINSKEVINRLGVLFQ